MDKEKKTAADINPQDGAVEKNAVPKEGEVVETATEGAVDGATQEPKSRDLFYERIRTNFPDANYEKDEDGYYRDALTRMDALEKDSKILGDLTNKLNSRLGSNPQEAEVMLDWLDGVDIRTAITRHMGADALTAPEEGSDEYENWNKANEDRKKELSDMKAKVDEYRANAEASVTALQEFAKETGLSEEQAAELESYFTNELLPDIYAGKIGKGFYSLIHRGRNYEADVDGAREQGRVDGRNEKIEIEKKRLAGSGLPNGKTGGNASEEVETPKGSDKTADWLAKMSKRRV